MDYSNEQKEDTMGLMNTNTVFKESVTPQIKGSSTQINKLTSEKEQTEKSKHSTTEENKENLDIGNDAKTVDIYKDPSFTSPVTTPCVCPTTSSLSTSTQSTTPGILTTSGSCVCPDITSSMVEGKQY